MMTREQARNKAAALVRQMTVEEAASQLRFDAPAIERLGIPAYNWWNEALHGVARAGTATSFPQAIGLGATFDPILIEMLGEVVGTEGRAKYNAASRFGDRDIYKGLTFWSPNVNIFRDPRWGRGQETYGEDPTLTATLGAAYVRGIQGNNDTMLAAACAKHFAVHSGPEAIRHEFDAQASEKDMEETYLPAFRELVRAGVESVMGAYNRTNGEPCCANHFLMNKLRHEWGFHGHFVSDCWAVRDFHEGHHVTSRPEESVAMALEAGCDVNCGCTYQYIMKALDEGLVKEEWVRRSAERLFTTRYLLGLMEGSKYDRIGVDAVECAEHLRLAEEASRKSLVLLKNDGTLPIDLRKIHKIAVIGPNANSRAALIGNYHGTSSRYVTVLEGIQDAVQGRARVFYAEGCPLYADRMEELAQPDDRLSEAKSIAEYCDVTVLVVGLDETLEGEEGEVGGDKRDLLLPECQRRLMDAVLEMGKPTIICLMAGSAIDLGEAGDRANAVLMCWYPGARGGKSVADVLLGNTSPSGKLPVTFYKNEQLAEMPDFTDYAMRGRTYRYFEGTPRYPFGFGLTYGDVRVENVACWTLRKEKLLILSATVRNLGIANTQEVIQVYAQNEHSSHAPRNPRLVAFKRVHCRASSAIVVSFQIPLDRFKVVTDDGRRINDGRTTLYVGTGQPDPLTEALTGHPSYRVPLKDSDIR